MIAEPSALRSSPKQFSFIKSYCHITIWQFNRYHFRQRSVVERQMDELIRGRRIEHSLKIGVVLQKLNQKAKKDRGAVCPATIWDLDPPKSMTSGIGLCRKFTTLTTFPQPNQNHYIPLLDLECIWYLYPSLLRKETAYYSTGEPCWLRNERISQPSKYWWIYWCQKSEEIRYQTIL